MNTLSSLILNSFIKKSGQQIIVPFYHAVSNKTPNFIGGLYPPRKIANFKRDIDVLLKYYEPISLSKLMDLVNSEKKITKKYFHLTFDDGLANFYNIVAPILKERNIPATVFLNTDFVDNKDLFYRYKASLLLEKYKKATIKIKEEYHNIIGGNNLNSVSSYLLNINFNNKELLDVLANKIDYSFLEELIKEKPYLTLNQIKELKNEGFTFGAHSQNHPFYGNLTLSDQIEQTTNSLNWIYKNLEINYKAFSFPFSDEGVTKKFFDTMNNKKLVDISFGTFGIKNDSVKNNVQRISFEFANKNAELFLLKEYLNYFLKIPFGKHKLLKK